jgi:hypothetical protein
MSSAVGSAVVVLILGAIVWHYWSVLTARRYARRQKDETERTTDE